MTTAAADPAEQQHDAIVRGIPANLVDAMWHYAEPYVKRALDHANGEFTAENFRGMCRDRSMQLWLVSRGTRVIGCITTEIVVYPQCKHVRVITVAGTDFANWIEPADTLLMEWAKAQGCNAIESYVRKGLVPKMAPHGYKHKHCVLVKELP
jgi:hypothetical protein